MHRRSLLTLPLALLAAGVLLLTRAPLAPAAGPGAADASALAGGGVPVTVYAFFDLPRADPRSHDLSGIAWDARTSTLYGIRDRDGQIVTLRPSADYRTWTLGGPIQVTIDDGWDGEGIVLTERGFFVSNEVGPHVYELDANGNVTAEVALPAHFGGIRSNLALESLALTPDGRYLFTANEQALESDGPTATADAGTTVRIMRYDRQTQAQVEYAYRTDPIFARATGDSPGDRGVAEVVALTPSELLVMERSFVPNVGNDIRIYRVGLAGAANVIGTPNLSAQTPVVAKTLLVDFVDLPDNQFPAALQPQPNNILDNFEGMALGPRLPDGRRLLFVISDDNSRDTQVPRILVLAVSGL